jgi:hypothetical protein
MSQQNNLFRIKAVHEALGPLKNDVVFVGGATVALYADREAEEPRFTEDIDILIELWAYNDYTIIESQLLKMGFVNDKESGIICRYRFDGIVVDVMATGENVLGFGNKWYPQGFKNSLAYKTDIFSSVKIFSAPYFIATKLEAFKSPDRRDNNNGIQSADFEDIIFVLANRLSVWQELSDASEDVKEYLQSEFKKLLNNPRIEEWVDSHAGFGSPPLTNYILDHLKKFTEETK